MYIKFNFGRNIGIKFCVFYVIRLIKKDKKNARSFITTLSAGANYKFMQLMYSQAIKQEGLQGDS